MCYTKYTIKEDEWLVSLKTTQLPNGNKCVSLNEQYNEEATPTSYIVYICCKLEECGEQ